MSEFLLKRKRRINCPLRGQIASMAKRFIVTNEPRKYLQCCIWRVCWRATAACLNSVSRTWAALSVGLVLAVALGAMARGEDYPSRVITLIAPSGPGSTPDVLARILAHKLSEQLGKQVVVLNRVGAGTDIGTAGVAHAEPDGYTLLLGSIANTLNPHIKTSVGYKLDDLAPISSVAATADVLVVHPSTNISTVQELIAFLKSNPGTPAGHGGIGTAPHLSLELFRRMSGIEITPVPFKGGGEALQGVLAEQVFFIFNTSVSVLPLVRGGQLRALAASSAKRISASPEIPTLAESGLPGFDIVAWFGLFAPAQTPKSIINRLSEETRKALAAPDTRKLLADVGAEPLGSTPEAFSAYVKEEFERWGKLSKELDIHVE
jgi:tripartite-type tricarboxylate transporter receptor subunit TctC